MPETVKFMRLGKCVLEVPVDMFPLQVEMSALKSNGDKYPRKFTLNVNYWADPGTYQKDKTRPKGMQLS